MTDLFRRGRQSLAAILIATLAAGCSPKHDPAAGAPRSTTAAAPADSTHTWGHARTLERGLDAALETGDLARAGELARGIREHASSLEQSRGDEAQDRAGLNMVNERVRGYATRIERGAAAHDTTGVADARSRLHQSLRDLESQFPLGVPPLP